MAFSSSTEGLRKLARFEIVGDLLKEIHGFPLRTQATMIHRSPSPPQGASHPAV